MGKVSLKSLNSFGLDVFADELISITTDQELKSFLQSEKAKKPFLVIGKGSNILFTKDFAGTVLIMDSCGIDKVSEDGNQVVLRAKAGENFDHLVHYALRRGYYGLENLAKIPGKVGSCPIQNIGAYGKEVKDFIFKVHALAVSDGSYRIFTNAKCEFGYRSSVFKTVLKGQYIITAVDFKLSRVPNLHIEYADLKEQLNDKKQISPQDVYDAVASIRKEKLPDPKQLGNAGSFFKNPIISTEQWEELKEKHENLIWYPAPNRKIKLAAGQLIERLGWKGQQTGNVGVHPQQALVLVNYGGATGLEILHLAQEIQKDVLDNFGVSLEMEVNVV